MGAIKKRAVSPNKRTNRKRQNRSGANVCLREAASGVYVSDTLPSAPVASALPLPVWVGTANGPSQLLVLDPRRNGGNRPMLRRVLVPSLWNAGAGGGGSAGGHVWVLLGSGIRLL